jgi:hypothetical protein
MIVRLSINTQRQIEQIDDKQRGIESETSENREETLRKRITTSIVTMFFSHILGKIGSSARVASQGLSILGYHAIVKKIIISKPLRLPNYAVCVANI